MKNLLHQLKMKRSAFALIALLTCVFSSTDTLFAQVKLLQEVKITDSVMFFDGNKWSGYFDFNKSNANN